jgi:hypothetical protein
VVNSNDDEEWRKEHNAYLIAQYQYDIDDDEEEDGVSDSVTVNIDIDEKSVENINHLMKD